MPPKVIFHYPHLIELVNGQVAVEVSGSTVGECLDDLVKQFPPIRSKIFDEHGNLLHFISILHNGNSLYKEQDPLAKPVKDDDEITIILLIAGG